MAALDGLAIAGRETRHEPKTRPPRSSRGAMDWDDVRVFLAVAREGSMRAAGRALGLSQPTIARRLAAFEVSFGGPILFDRLPEGLRLNAAGEQLVPAAESVEDAVLTLERRHAAASPVLNGTVRISTGECAAGFLSRCLSGSTTSPLPTGITLEVREPRCRIACGSWSTRRTCTGIVHWLIRYSRNFGAMVPIRREPSSRSAGLTMTISSKSKGLSMCQEQSELR
jgi:hypothetical protein